MSSPRSSSMKRIFPMSNCNRIPIMTVHQHLLADVVLVRFYS